VRGAGDFSKAYEKVNRAVVLIDFQDGAREVGSGVVVGITPRGSAVILTADHVVTGYDQVLVYFAGSIEPSSGRVHERFFDQMQDLAVVVVEHAPSDVDVISFRESVGKKGESIGTVGHPLGELYTWSGGNITNIHGKYVTHDARLARGSSGGPLLDGCGRMLGLNVHVVEVPEEDDLGLTQDTVEGSSVALGAATIISSLEGWLGEMDFREHWRVKKYCSFWHRLYQDRLFNAAEVVIAGAVAYLFWPDDDGVKEFGEPPPPP
jgi:S1-C subfamily serine protease